MDNFGDLMFPLVAADRLARHGIEVAAASPTGRATMFADAMPTIPIADIVQPDVTADAVVIGGGYIIHAHRMDVLRTYRDGDCGAWAGPSTWLGATLAAALRDIPVAWNAPGAPHPLPARLRPLAAAALRAADYASLRDAGSARMLPPNDATVIVPDPIADLAKVWPRASLDGAFRRVIKRLAIAEPEKIVAVHARRRSLGDEPPAEFAARLDAFAAQAGVTPLLIGVGSSHGDDVFARTLASHMPGGALVLDAPEHLAEIAATIANARAYLGSSLHGYVTATAYGVPGVLVARPAYQKFRGYVAHTGRTTDLARNWTEALDRAPAMLTETPPPLPQSLTDALDAHWAAIAAAVHGGPAPRRAERLAFAAASFAEGMRTSGTGWASVPFVEESNRIAALAGDDVRDVEPF